jgi:hypothetical protein
MIFALRAAFVVAISFSLAGCNSLYYAGMEKLGKEKRDILIKRIVEGKKDQEEAREQIKTTLERFQELTGFQGGDLEKAYNKLNGEYEESRERADDLSKQIKSINQVANDMFAEWDKEIGQMRNSSLRAQSRTLLRDAQTKHRQYMVAMRNTESKMRPVLQVFQDQVLFLKHNLNARAIRSLKGTAEKIDLQVDALIADMERSLKESDEFVSSLNAAGQS